MDNLLGKRISLVSKKNIRYEGTLYSVNEADATLALQNVRSYGTEGREKTEEEANYIAPQDSIHPYLLFRGCDIKDLHVHEDASSSPASQSPSKPATTSQGLSEQSTGHPTKHEDGKGNTKTTNAPAKADKIPSEAPNDATTPQVGNEGSNKPNRRAGKSQESRHAVGTGASLLNRKVRGSVNDSVETPKEDFDFQSNLANFDKRDDLNDSDAGNLDELDSAAYAKDDFFDSISCDALDKINGVDNRLRGSRERNLNTETFGAVALNSQRRRRRGGGRGRGRGRGRGGRQGRGRGRGNGSRRTNRSGDLSQSTADEKVNQ